MMYKLNVFSPTGPLPHDATSPPDMSAKISMAFDTQVRILATKSHNKLTDIDMWHHHLGHVNYDTVQQISKNNIVQGIHITNSAPCLGTCEDCIMGKHTR